MEYTFRLAQLTTKFYEDYPHNVYPEILNKEKRAYNCFIFKLWDDRFICVPYRTEINHKYAYSFKQSARSKLHNSGLDFSKSVIITDENYICTQSAVVDTDEFHETIANIDIIANKVLQFVTDYIDYIKFQNNMSKQEFNRRYRYSPLKYFHKELNINND